MPIINQRTSRLPVVGQIRIGEKNERGFPYTTETFRLTSQNRDLLEEAKAIYGGEVAEWPSVPNSYILRTTTRTLKAIFNLTPTIGGDCQSMRTYYEKHTQAGMERRCDGQQCELRQDKTASMVPCLCGEDVGTDPKKFCSLVVRVSVVLPQLQTSGNWVLATHSANFLDEWTAFADMCRQLVATPLIPVLLQMTSRESKMPGEKPKQFTVVSPMVDPDPVSPGEFLQSLANKLQGPGTGAALSTQSAPALESMAPETDDEDINPVDESATPQVATWTDVVFGGKADDLLRAHGISLDLAKQWHTIGVQIGQILAVTQKGLSTNEFRERVLRR